MTPFIVLAGLGLTLAVGAFFGLPYLRAEAIEYQERHVAEWEDTVERNPIPQYMAQLEKERAKLARMKAKQPAVS